MADVRHRNITESEKHEPKNFGGGAVYSRLLKDENSQSRYAKEQFFEPALEFLDGNVTAPATPTIGDKYVLIDEGNGTVDASWDGASYNDWVRWNGVEWVAVTPTDGVIIRNLDENVFYEFKVNEWVLLLDVFGVFAVRNSNGVPTFYNDFEDALDNVSTGGVIEQFADYTGTFDADYNLNKDVNLNINGYHLKIILPLGINLATGKKFHVFGGGSFEGETTSSNGSLFLMSPNSELTSDLSVNVFMSDGVSTRGVARTGTGTGKCYIRNVLSKENGTFFIRSNTSNDRIIAENCFVVQETQGGAIRGGGGCEMVHCIILGLVDPNSSQSNDILALGDDASKLKNCTIISDGGTTIGNVTAQFINCYIENKNGDIRSGIGGSTLIKNSLLMSKGGEVFRHTNSGKSYIETSTLYTTNGNCVKTNISGFHIKDCKMTSDVGNVVDFNNLLDVNSEPNTTIEDCIINSGDGDGVVFTNVASGLTLTTSFTKIKIPSGHYGFNFSVGTIETNIELTKVQGGGDFTNQTGIFDVALNRLTDNIDYAGNIGRGHVSPYPEVTETERDNLTGLKPRFTIYNSTANELQVWNGTVWKTLLDLT